MGVVSSLGALGFQRNETFRKVGFWIEKEMIRIQIGKGAHQLIPSLLPAEAPYHD